MAITLALPVEYNRPAAARSCVGGGFLSYITLFRKQPGKVVMNPYSYLEQVMRCRIVVLPANEVGHMTNIVQTQLLLVRRAAIILLE